MKKSRNNQFIKLFLGIFPFLVGAILTPLNMLAFVGVCYLTGEVCLYALGGYSVPLSLVILPLIESFLIAYFTKRNVMAVLCTSPLLYTIVLSLVGIYDERNYPALEFNYVQILSNLALYNLLALLGGTIGSGLASKFFKR